MFDLVLNVPLNATILQQFVGVILVVQNFKVLVFIVMEE